MRAPLLLLLLLAACSGVEAEIARTRMREDFKDFLYGGDRGIGEYARTIEQSTTRPVRAEPYQYVGVPYLANYMVMRSVRGLGGTRIRNASDLVSVADRLLHVAAHDPVAVTRAEACLQLARHVVRLPLPPQAEEAPDPKSVPRILEIANDLLQIENRVRKGEKVAAGEVVERLQALAAQRPADMPIARTMVRALAARPVAGEPGAVAAEVERIGPRIVRDAALVSFRDMACGDPWVPGALPDPDPKARLAAAAALLRIRSPVAREAAVRRIENPIDPLESDPDVRRALLRYLAVVGDAGAFEACRVRLDDVDPGVRLHAQEALLAMTGADLPPSAEAWAHWREGQPSWKAPPPPAAESR